MNLTIRLLKSIGSPFVSTRSTILNPDEMRTLFRYSEKNRMSFLFLDTKRADGSGIESDAYRKEDARRLKIDEAVARASEVLRDADVDHAIFKTIRPYRSTTVDIDTLVFADTAYAMSIGAMQEAGYNLIVRGPRSTTLWDQEADIGVDLYEQVAVSFVIYMNKTTLADHSVITKLPNNSSVRVLKPEADLACIIAHSIIKEQMYTLSEYYSYIYYLRQMSVDNFLEIVKQNNMTVAARTHTAITALLHHTAHKTVPDKLQQVQNSLGKEDFETARLITNDFDAPHKYHPITVVRSLLEIAKGRETRRSMAEQAIHLFDPKISRDFLNKLFNHISRQTY